MVNHTSILTRSALLSLLDKTAECLCTINAQDQIIWVNEAFCQCSGYSKEELLHNDVNSLFHQNITTFLYQQALIEKLEENGEAFITSFTNSRKDTVSASIWLKDFTKDDHHSVLTFQLDTLQESKASTPSPGAISEVPCDTNDFLKQFIQQTPHLAYVIDQEGTLLQVSSVFSSYLTGKGLPPIQQPLKDFFQEEDFIHVQAQHQHVFATKEALHAEEVQQTSRGKTYFYTLKYPYIEHQHNATLLLSISIDVTKFKLALKHLKESRGQYITMIESLDIPITVYDKASRIVYINKKGAQNLNTTQETLFGQSLQELIPETYQTSKPRFDEVFSTGQTKVYEDVVALPVGTRYFSSTFHPLYNYPNTGNVILAISYDVTSLKQATQLVSENENRLKFAMKGAHMGMFSWDLVTGEVQWDELMYTLFDLEKGKEIILQEDFADRLHPEDRTRVMTDTHQVLSYQGDETEFQDEYRIIARDQSVKYIESQGLLLKDAQGKLSKIIGTCRDITPMKTAQKELIEYLRLINVSQDLFAVIDFDGYFVQLNQAWEDTLGYSLEEIKSRPFIKMVHPGDVERTLQQTQHMQHNFLEALRFENRYICKDGSVRWFSWRTNMIPGTKLHYCGVRDITAEKEAQLALIHNQERINSIANSIPGALLRYKVNADGTDELLYISDHVERLWEIPREDVLNNVSLLWEVIPEQHAQAMQTSIKKSIDGMTFWDHTWPIQTRSGKKKWLNGRGFPKKQPDGGIVWDTLILDITHQKKAEHKLRESETRFRSIFENSAAGIIIYTPEQKILLTNKALQKMLGYTNQELTAIGYATIIHPQDFNIAMEFFKQQEDGFEQTNLEIRFISKDNRIFWVELFASPYFSVDDTNRFTICMVNNITPRKLISLKLDRTINELQNFQRALNRSASISFTDLDGKITHVNDLFCKTTKYTKAEIVGKTHTLVNSGYHPQRFFKELWTTIRREIPGKVKSKTKPKTAACFG